MGIKEKYKLYLRWSSLEKNKDEVCSLFGCCFYGPVIKEVKQINPNDSIVIDFTPQYSKVLSSYYFATLRWGAVNVEREKIYLRDVYLSGPFVNGLLDIEENFSILIDTENHEEDVHMFNLVYKGFIVNREGKMLEI